MRRLCLIAVTALAAMLGVSASAQAVVVDLGALGKTSVPYDASQTSNYAGVALVPGSQGALAQAGVPVVTSSGVCNDPSGWLTEMNLTLPPVGSLCWQGGPVLHQIQEFAVTWDPYRQFWAQTRYDAENFLHDVAAGDPSSSPFGVARQYWDGSAPSSRALGAVSYGGGCIDYGDPGGAVCQIGNSELEVSGNAFPASGCKLTLSGQSAPVVCLTDTQLRTEVGAMVAQLQKQGTLEAGYTPLVVLMTPMNVVDCLDASGTLCSVGSSAPATFCSYHSYVPGTNIAYVVQPWAAFTKCVDPDVPALPQNPTPEQLADNAGASLPSPISQSELGAITDPQLNGWFSQGGGEIEDNGCGPLGNGLDTETVNGDTYYLQREFNDAAMLENDPATYFGCAPNVVLDPQFVAPAPVSAGDVVAFDGSGTQSTLLVPNANYQWKFGDGTTATGPSVEHTYQYGGTYTVTLTVLDRGAFAGSVSHQVTVSGKPAPGSGGGGGSSGGSGSHLVSGPPLQVHLLMLPQSLAQVMRHGVAVRVTSNEAANGFATLTVTRAAAKRAKLRAGHTAAVVVGRGTVSRVKAGVLVLHFKLSRRSVKKLRETRHLALTVRLSLIDGNGHRLTVDVAGRF